jgi:hypothetical protein
MHDRPFSRPGNPRDVCARNQDIALSQTRGRQVNKPRDKSTTARMRPACTIEQRVWARAHTNVDRTLAENLFLSARRVCQLFLVGGASAFVACHRTLAEGRARTLNVMELGVQSRQRKLVVRELCLVE